MVTAALADYRCTILDLISEGDRVFARMRFEGIHRRPFMGFSPIGKPVEWSGAALFTLEAGKIADLWVLGDVDGLESRLARNA
jgi:predicted ester cyclase